MATPLCPGGAGHQAGSSISQTCSCENQKQPNPLDGHRGKMDDNSPSSVIGPLTPTQTGSPTTRAHLTPTLEQRLQAQGVASREGDVQGHGWACAQGLRTRIPVHAPNAAIPSAQHTPNEPAGGEDRAPRLLPTHTPTPIHRVSISKVNLTLLAWPA